MTALEGGEKEEEEQRGDWQELGWHADCRGVQTQGDDLPTILP